MSSFPRQLRLHWIVLGALGAWCLLAPAQTSRPTAGVEPGEAEARQRTTTATRPTTYSSPAVEARGIWIASRDMLLPRHQLAEKLDHLKAANFNTLLIDTYFRGHVAYPDSQHLGQFPPFSDDVLGWLIDQCRQRGMEAHLWMEYGFYSYFTDDATKDPSMGRILDEHPELVSLDAAGNKYLHRTFGDFYSICPSNPRSHQILADIFTEAVRKYPRASGINLDRIRYAGGDYCYCDYCKEHFHNDTGIVLQAFQAGSVEAKRFLEWKRQQTVKAVETIVKAVRAARPDIVITSYVVGPDEMHDKAQAWDLWMHRGLLDAVAVSMYGADIREPINRSIALLGPHRGKLIAALSCDQENDTYLTNIELTRGAAALGQYTWHFGDVWDNTESLKRGPYARPATSPLD